MSKRTDILFINLEHFAAAEARYNCLQIGCAMRLLMAEACGSPLADLPDAQIAKALVLSKYRWLKNKANVLTLLADFRGGSYSKTIYGRERVPQWLRDAVFERDGEACVYCGAAEGPFHIDHRLALARGGRNDFDNLCVACRPCNLSKAAKSLEEWLS